MPLLLAPLLSNRDRSFLHRVRPRAGGHHRGRRPGGDAVALLPAVLPGKGQPGGHRRLRRGGRGIQVSTIGDQSQYKDAVKG